MAQIVDQWGKPIQREALREPQTSRLAQLRSEWENHPSRGLTPAKLAKIMQWAEQGDLIAQHELYQDIEEKDGHIFSCMQTRRLALQGLDWDVVAPEHATPEEEELAQFAKGALLSMQDFDDVLFDMTDAIGHGFAALELEWGTVGGEKLPLRASHRAQSWFTTSRALGGDRNELRLRDGTADGSTLWPFGWVVHRHKSRSGYVARSGLYRMLLWPFLFKNYAVRDLAEFLEIYGLPLRLGSYSTAATDQDKATLLRAVVGIGHDAAAIIPEGMAIDFKSAAQGDNKAFDAMISHMERVISKVVLGGTLTSGEGQNGTQALGKIHNEVRHDILKSDARQLGATVTRDLIYPILAINRGVTSLARCPRLVLDTQEPEDVKLYADAIPKLTAAGMRISVAWAHEKLKIPQADQKEAVLHPPQAAAVATAAAGDAGGDADGQKGKPPARTAMQQGAERTGLAALSVPVAGEADQLEGLADEMLGEWEDTLGELVEPIEAALASAASFEDFSAALEEKIAGIPPERLVDMLARGNFAARVWGRLNQAQRPPAEK